MVLEVTTGYATTTGTTATLMPTGGARREKPQPPLSPTLTMATMATATAIIPTMAMATGEGRRGETGEKRCRINDYIQVGGS